jgi:hypothetical protein
MRVTASVSLCFCQVGNYVALAKTSIGAPAFLGKEKRNENANARLKFQQKDKEFVHHLYNKFKPLGIVGVDPRKTSYTHKLTNNTHTSYQFTTFTLPFFTELHSQWYVQRDGKDIKIVRADFFQVGNCVALEKDRR